MGDLVKYKYFVAKSQFFISFTKCIPMLKTSVYESRSFINWARPLFLIIKFHLALKSKIKLLSKATACRLSNANHPNLDRTFNQAYNCRLVKYSNAARFWQKIPDFTQNTKGRCKPWSINYFLATRLESQLLFIRVYCTIYL